MKKLLRIFTLALGALAAIGASAENPTELYLVGSMNGWVAPAEGGTRYKLTDPDGDGTYTGTFEIPASESLEFKVFDGLYGWGDTEHFYGRSRYNNTSTFINKIYSDITVEDRIIKGTYETENISCDNWLGGELEISITLNDEGWITSLKGSDQPTFGVIPDKVWLIGSFNDFKLPTSGNDNGAISISKYTDQLLYMEEPSVSLPAGDVEMRLYVPELGSLSGINIGASQQIDWAPENLRLQGAESATLYRSVPNGFGGVSYCGQPESPRNFVLRDWSGGKIANIAVKFHSDSPERFAASFSIGSYECKEIEIPNPLYLIKEQRGAQPELVEIEHNRVYSFDIGLGKDGYSFLLTSEKSLTPDPTNCWEAIDDKIASFALHEGDYHKVGNMYIPFQKGSTKPMTFNTSNASGHISTYFNIFNSNIELSYNLGFFNGNDLYLIGSLKGDPQNGGWNITDPSMKLEYKGEGIFTGAFPVANSEDVEFRFYTALGDWASNSIGSGYDDFMPEVINLPYQGACVDGKGNWKVNGFTGETLYVQVDLKNMKVLFDDEPLGGIADAVAEAGLSVDGLTVSSADGSAIEMYDLYGRRIASGPAVQAPARGLYIVRGARGAAKLRF